MYVKAWATNLLRTSVAVGYPGVQFWHIFIVGEKIGDDEEIMMHLEKGLASKDLTLCQSSVPTYTGLDFAHCHLES